MNIYYTFNCLYLKMDEDKKVFVGNLPPTSFTDKGLREFFEKFGPVRDAFVLRDAQTNRGRRCGIVTFDDSETAEHVKALKDHDMALKLKGNRYFRIASVEPMPKNVVATNVSSWQFYDRDDYHSDVIDSASDIIKSTRDVSIDALNDYCLLHIFEFFTLGYSINFERVCKRWKKLLRSRWTRLTKLPLEDFEFCYETGILTTDKLIKLMSRTDHNILVLDLTNTVNIMDYNILGWIARLAPKVQQLALNHAYGSRKSVKEFARKVKDLKKLKLDCNVKISDSSIKRILKNSPDLEHLNLVGNQMDVSGSCFQQSIPKLKSVCLVNFSNLQGEHLEALFLKSKHIEEIKLENCQKTEPTFANSLLNLEYLKILKYRGSYGNMLHYKDPGLSSLGLLKSLVFLDLAFNVSVNKNLLDQLSSNCQGLTHLNLMCCQGEPLIDDQSIGRLRSLENLKYLNLNYAVALTDVSMTHLSQIKTLEHLELVGIAYDRITSLGAFTLVENLPKLSRLDLSGNRDIDEYFLTGIEPLGTIRQTRLCINLGKISLPISVICNPPKFGNIFTSMHKTCETRFRFDRSGFYVGGFMPPPQPDLFLLLDENDFLENDDTDEDLEVDFHELALVDNPHLWHEHENELEDW